MLASKTSMVGNLERDLLEEKSLNYYLVNFKLLIELFRIKRRANISIKTRN